MSIKPKSEYSAKHVVGYAYIGGSGLYVVFIIILITFVIVYLQ